MSKDARILNGEGREKEKEIYIEYEVPELDSQRPFYYVVIERKPFYYKGKRQSQYPDSVGDEVFKEWW